MILDPHRAARRAPVTFLLGPAGSGKTARCIEQLHAHEHEGRPAIYLVPEQSTYLADRLLLEPPGPEAMRHVRVLSFRRLAHILALEADPHAAARPLLNPASARILLRRLFARLDPALARPFATIIDRPRFLETLIGALRELRLEGKPGRDDLRARVHDRDLPEDLRAKLGALLALLEAFEAVLEERGIRDMDQALLDAPSRVRSNPEPFRALPILIDGFLSFTRAEGELLAALYEAGAALTVALCLDRSYLEFAEAVAEPAPPGFRMGEWPRSVLERGARPAFLASLRTYVELTARLRSLGFASRLETLSRPPPRFHSADLAVLEANLLRGEAPAGRAPLDIEALVAGDPTHEVETWARRIDRWIRLDPDPVRPGSIAVIVRDLERYRPIIEETFARYRIPVFVDRHWDLSTRPLVRTIIDALDVLRSHWARDAVISFLRSPLLRPHGCEVDLLENLALETGKDHQEWFGRPWEALLRPPRESIEGGEPEEEREREAERFRVAQLRTAIADRVRERFLYPLRRFEAAWPAAGDGLDGAAAIAALRAWLREAGIDASGTGTRAGGPAAGDPQSRREREAVAGVLDSIGSELAGERVGLEVFATLLRAGFDSLSIGRTPTRLDQVTVAEVQRSRLGEVRRAIVGGLSEADFPRPATTTRLLTDRERQLLARHGVVLGGCEAARLEEEFYFFYIALTRASERLVLTRPACDLEGRALASSPFLGEVLNGTPGLSETRAAMAVDPADLTAVQTPEELAAHIGAYIASRLDRRRVARHTPEMEPGAAADDARILAAYNRLVGAGVPGTGVPAARSALARTSRLWGYDNHPVLPASIVSMAGGGGTFTTSAGKLEAFARCPYQHFARHALRLEPRPRPQVTPLDNGILVHRALETLLREGSPAPDRAQIRTRLEGIFQKLESEALTRAYHADPAGRFRWKTVRGQLARFVEIEAARLAGSAFTPLRLEAAFGEDAKSALALDLPGGGRALVRGRIDRLDIDASSHPAEAIVIDYKTKHRPGRGRLADLEFGTDLQLAVYLLAVSGVLGLIPIAGLYAAVLPGPADGPPKDPANPLAIKLHGLVPKDQAARITGGLAVLSNPQRKLADTRELRAALEKARTTITLYAAAIQRGVIDVAPIRRGGWSACRGCDLSSVCRVDDAYNPPRLSTLEGLGAEP